MTIIPVEKVDLPADNCCGKEGLAVRLKALGHPVRLEIIARLIALKEPCCNDVCKCLPLAQSTVSKHLEILRKAGLIVSRQAGNRSCFSLNRDALMGVSAALANIGGNPPENLKNSAD